MRLRLALLALVGLSGCGSTLHQSCEGVFAHCDGGQVCMAHVNIAGETTARTCEFPCGGEANTPCPQDFECQAVPDEIGPHCVEKK